jgi:cell division protein FtsW (lipid II flippase)
MLLQQRGEFLPESHTDFVFIVQGNVVALVLSLILIALAFVWWRKRHRGKDSTDGVA